MSTTVITGHQGNFVVAAGDNFDDVLGSSTSTMTGQITNFALKLEQEDILHTPFPGSGSVTFGKQYYKGRAVATVDFDGAYPSGHIFGGAAMSAAAYQDFTPNVSKMDGAGATTTAHGTGDQATGTILMTLTSSTGETITIKGSLFNEKLGVNKRSGLNTISGQVVGEVTAAATA